MIKKIILWILTICCVVGIFMFSAQPAPQSGGLSKSFTKEIMQTFSFYQSMEREKQTAFIETADEVVRSLAHVFVFFVLGICVCALISSYGLKYTLLWSLLFCILYAIFDECHQGFFVDGRAFQIIDLCKDWFGSFLGISLTATICRKR
ncbi:MAG: VanZ family protein [Clostridiales bacterium]